MHEQLIRAIRNIITINNIEEQLIVQLFHKKEFKKGDYFLREGQVCREVGFINSGLLRYYIINDGEDKIYDFGKEGNFVCNYESFLDRSPSSKNIQFLEDAHLLVISFNDLQQFYIKIKEGQKFGRIICEQIFVDALQKITSLYTDSPENRYKHFVDFYPELQQRIPQYYISSFIGVKPQSLSRIRKRIIGK